MAAKINENGTVSFTCPTCQRPAHPATGAVYGPETVLCGPCVREAWAWAREQMKLHKRVGPRGRICRCDEVATTDACPKHNRRFVSFYEAAGKFCQV